MSSLKSKKFYVVLIVLVIEFVGMATNFFIDKPGLLDLLESFQQMVVAPAIVSYMGANVWEKKIIKGPEKDGKQGKQDRTRTENPR